MIRKRRSFGYALNYLQGRPATMDRYLQRFYTPYDWSGVKRFFFENSIQANVILEDFCKTNDAKMKMVVKLFVHGKSKIVFIVGARDSGKTATTFMFAEIVQREIERPIYYVSTQVRQEVLPSWMRVVATIGAVPNGSFTIIDESAIQFSARDFMQKDSKDMAKELKIARHKDLFLIFITQHIASTDIEVDRIKDLVIWKMSNDYSFGVRDKRSKEGKFWDKVRTMMAPRDKNECLFEYPAKRRFVHFKHGLPDCWTDALSKTWKDAEIGMKKESESQEKVKNPKVLKL